ncbi:hypothetical protein MHYP_G00290130 [Metynnis hypsauchen]
MKMEEECFSQRLQRARGIPKPPQVPSGPGRALSFTRLTLHPFPSPGRTLSLRDGPRASEQVMPHQIILNLTLSVQWSVEVGLRGGWIDMKSRLVSAANHLLLSSQHDSGRPSFSVSTRSAFIWASGSLLCSTKGTEVGNIPRYDAQYHGSAAIYWTWRSLFSTS